MENAPSKISLKTEIPGPRSKELMQRRAKAVVRASHSAPVFVKQAKGAMLEDVDGNWLLDFATGIAVMNLGHSHSAVISAVEKKIKENTHLQFNVTPYPEYIDLSEKLCQITPGKFEKRVFLANAGAEAIENAIKIARMATGKQAIVCFEHAFHGRTYMAMTLTHKTKPYKWGFQPFCPEIYRAKYPFKYRWNQPGSTSSDPSEAELSKQAFESFKDLVTTQIGPDKLAAVIIEPVSGEGGFIPAPPEFMKNLQQFCRENGVVLIADEIQTGFGRTGSMFACEQLGIEPDLITLAKGMGGGLPISAIVGRADIMDKIPEGAIGGTYSGNPLACVASLAVIEEMKKTEFLKNAASLGETLKSRLEMWKEKYPVVGDVRGLGPMRGIEFVKDKKTKEPDKDATAKLVKYCYERGLVILSAGTYGNVVRLLMPLNIDRNQLEEGLKIIESGIATL
jgi:4-aminobutyrate aminotransferase/(S)-3-amino-2-methylpropionate transaminase